MIAMLLIASLFASSPAPADKRCEPLRSPMRVRLTVGSDQWKDAAPTVRRLVEDTWASTGLNIEWVDAGRNYDGVDLWIALVPKLNLSGEPYPFGMIYFDGDRPARLARVSVDAVVDWARLFRTRLLRTPATTIGGSLVDRDLVHRVLGYAAAHEAGHFILETKSHADSGVMQATYRHPEKMFDAATWQLDGRNATTLKQRLSCDAGYGLSR